MMNEHDNPPCGVEIPLPPMHCARPMGHRGTHSTDLVPEPLSAVAAEMVTERDRFVRERGLQAADYETRVRHLRIALYATAAAGLITVGIAIAFIHVLMHGGIL